MKSTNFINNYKKNLDASFWDRDNKFLYGALLFVGSVVIFYKLYDYGLAVYDEGFIVTGAQEILRGRIIYKDFFKEYTPGNFMLPALLFKLFGTNILIERFVMIFVRATSVLLLYLLCSRLSKGFIVFIPPIMLLLAPGPWHKSFIPFFTLLDLYFFCRFIDNLNYYRVIVLGFLTAATIFFRQDIGAFFIVTVLVSIISIPEIKKMARFSIMRLVIVYLFSILFFFTPVIYYFLNKGALNDFINDCFISSWDVRIQTKKFPFPRFDFISFNQGMSGFFYYIPIIFFFIILCYIIATRDKENRKILLPITVMGLFSFVDIYEAPDHSHLLQLSTPTYLLGAFISDKIYNNKFIYGVAKGTTGLILLFLPCYFILSLLCSPLATNIYSPTPMLLFSKSQKLANPRAPVFLPVNEADAIEKTVNFIKTHFRKNEPVFVIPPSYILSFLSGRENYSSSDFFFSSEFLSQEKKQVLLKRIVNSPPQFIIVDKIRMFQPDNIQKLIYLRSFYKNYPGMFNFVINNYSVYKIFGEYAVLKFGVNRPSRLFYCGVRSLIKRKPENAFEKFDEAEHLGLPKGMFDPNKLFTEPLCE